MPDDAEHPLQLRGVLVARAAADPAELQRAQGLALTRRGAVRGADLLDRHHQEEASSASPDFPSEAVEAGSPAGASTSIGVPPSSSPAGASTSFGVSSLGAPLVVSAAVPSEPTPSTSRTEIPRSFATSSGRRRL